MSDFNAFAEEALNNLKNLVTTELQEHSQAALQDAKDFLEKSRQDLARWLQLKADGQLTTDDLAWLIKGKKDVARLQALKQAGVSLARLDKFQGDLLGVVINTAATGLSQITIRGGPPRSKAKARGKVKAVAAKKKVATRKRPAAFSRSAKTKRR